MPYITNFERLAREGRIEGERIGLHLAIEFGLERKYGTAGEACLPEISKINDAPLLRSILEAIQTTSTIEELRRIWS